MTQEVEYLHNKYKALSSNPSTKKRKTKLKLKIFQIEKEESQWSYFAAKQSSV
jgi:hypothetical protein